MVIIDNKFLANILFRKFGLFHVILFLCNPKYFILKIQDFNLIFKSSSTVI